MHDSRKSGALTPTESPITDGDLDNIFRQIVIALSDLPEQFVRSRWQTAAPTHPPATINWCSVGITEISHDEPEINHRADGEGNSVLSRQERLVASTRFYGPQAMHYATQVRDGLYIDQNHSLLNDQNMGLIGVSKLNAVADVIYQQWVRRYDLSLIISRQIKRVYAVRHLLSTQGILDTEARIISF